MLHPKGGGGGYSGFQVTGVIEWGQKWKPKTSLGLKQPSPPQKKTGPTFNPHPLPPKFPDSIKCYNTQTIRTEIKLPKKILPKFSYPKKPPKSFDPPCQFSTGVPSPPRMQHVKSCCSINTNLLLFCPSLCLFAY